jgi:predicted lipid-binding transport protein (Tim44 family)
MSNPGLIAPAFAQVVAYWPVATATEFLETARAAYPMLTQAEAQNDLSSRNACKIWRTRHDSNV